MSLEAPLSMAAHTPFMSESNQSLRSTPPMASSSMRTSPAPGPTTPAPATDRTPSEARLAPAVDGTSSLPESNGVDASPTITTDAGASPPGPIAPDLNADIDPQIIEALKNKDRLFMLKLGEMMENLITERKSRCEILPASSYQRLLVHRSAAYYKCVPENDATSKGLIIFTTAESRIPARRIADLVPAEPPSQPAFKIMRRSSRDRMKHRTGSTAGSVAGEDADLSDVEPSEAGSLYSRSSTKKHLTIEEREAAYQQARSRIFMNFEEKEREKEKDMSATSSTFSVVSGSASTSAGGGSSVDDIETESVTTESEWSAPAGRDRKDIRRGGSGNGSISSRSWKSNSYRSGSHSARGSRGTSPSSFQYASIYEPPTSPYEATQSSGAPPPPGYVHYAYPYAPQQGQGPGQGYLAPYPYYSPYGYPMQPTHHSDPATPAATDLYPQPHMQPHMYQNPYMWPQPSMQAPLGPHPATSPPQHPAQPHPGQIPHTASFPPSNYMQPHVAYGPYPNQAYFAPPHGGQMMPPPPPPPMHGQMYPMDMNRPMNGNSHPTTTTHSRTSSRNSSQGRRSAPPVRAAWSYGPGATPGGYYGSDHVGPRLTSMRRMSGASSVGSGSAGNRTPGGDEASSTASSSTSSSSARTFTSTSTSSKHPLPARPDWAIGLRPEGSSRHHDSAPRGRNIVQGPQRPSPTSLQPTDFPPLSTASPPPRAPVAGAWTNSSSMRSILTPSTGAAGNQAPGNALVQYPSGHAQPAAPGEQDRTFERPPPKGNAELFNPKNAPVAAKRASGGASVGAKGGVPDGKKSMDEAGLVEKMGALAVTPGQAGSAAGAIST